MSSVPIQWRGGRISCQSEHCLLGNGWYLGCCCALSIVSQNMHTCTCLNTDSIILKPMRLLLTSWLYSTFFKTKRYHGYDSGSITTPLVNQLVQVITHQQENQCTLIVFYRRSNLTCACTVTHKLMIIIYYTCHTHVFEIINQFPFLSSHCLLSRAVHVRHSFKESGIKPACQ